jgi:hypothetical protein
MTRLVAFTVLGLSLGATLVACSNKPAPGPVVNAPPLPPIDGTYGGVLQLNRGSAINCGNDNPITLHVKDHAFYLPVGPTSGRLEACHRVQSRDRAGRSIQRTSGPGLHEWQHRRREYAGLDHWRCLRVQL